MDARQGVFQGGDAVKIAEAAVILLLIVLIAYALAGFLG